MCNNPACNVDRMPLIVEYIKQILPGFNPDDCWFAKNKMTVCVCRPMWQVYELLASNPNNGLGKCYTTIRKYACSYMNGEVKEPFNIACYAVLYNNSVNGRNSKNVAKLVSTMNLKSVLKELANPNVISYANNRKALPRKPMLSPEIKEQVYNKYRKVCPNIENHEAGENISHTCSLCDHTGFVYRTNKGIYTSSKKVDISHTSEGSWALNLDEDKYLDPNNMFLELIEENRSRAKQEAGELGMSFSGFAVVAIQLT